VDLHPSGFVDSFASGISGEHQVGGGSGRVPWEEHALLWRGSAASVVDLHPREFGSSHASGISGDQQIGWGLIDTGIGMPVWESRVLLWRGSAGSVVNLTLVPSGRVVAISGDELVGWGAKVNVGKDVWESRALLWRDSVTKAIDLHAFLPPGFKNSYATGVDSNGDIVGFASGFESYSSHAFLWRRNPPRAATSPGQETSRCETP
jgi:uncharacterized membrane protein